MGWRLYHMSAMVGMGVLYILDRRTGGTGNSQDLDEIQKGGRVETPLRQCWLVYELLYRLNHEKHEKGGKIKT